MRFQSETFFKFLCVVCMGPETKIDGKSLARIFPALYVGFVSRVLIGSLLSVSFVITTHLNPVLIKLQNELLYCGKCF